MRCLSRNKRDIWYSSYIRSEIVRDEYGNELPSPIPIYGKPKKLSVNVSAARGAVQEQQFGLDEKYDRVIVTDDMNLPITETSRLWIDTEPIRVQA